MNTQRLIACYVPLLVAHVAHVFEEIWGRFWLIEQVYGEGWFLLVNWVLFCVPVVLFYGVLHAQRWAYRLSIVYVAIMIVNGLGHTIVTLVTGQYFNGYAGGYTGMGLVLMGIPLIIGLWQALSATRPTHVAQLHSS